MAEIKAKGPSTANIQEMWSEAEREFERLTGKNLKDGRIRTFEDLQTEIESRSSAPSREDSDNDRKKSFKNAGLKVLECLKLLVGGATQLSSMAPIPSGAAQICSNALLFVFNIPAKVRELGVIIEEVLTTVSTALAKIEIYRTLQVNNELARHLHLVITSFIKLCAFVVNYQQGNKFGRFVFKMKMATLNDDSGLRTELSKFEKLVGQHHILEGAVILEQVIHSRKDMYRVLECAREKGQRIEDIHSTVTRLGEDATERKKEDAKTKKLKKIRNSLNISEALRLDSNTTPTCAMHHSKCHEGTGEWIWNTRQYQKWTSIEQKDNEGSPVLIISGDSASGKTLATAMITRRLENQEQKEVYVAHYFFSPSSKKSDDDNYTVSSSVQTALKSIAFQISRVDATVMSNLSEACTAPDGANFRETDLKELWKELRLSSTKLKGTYYILFDGLEYLSREHSEALLEFALSFEASPRPGQTKVKLLLSGTEKIFKGHLGARSIPQININKGNIADMELIVKKELSTRGLLQDGSPGSDQEKAGQLIRKGLPKRVKGNYSLLQFTFDTIIRRLNSGAGLLELQKILEQSKGSHEAAFQSLQRSLEPIEIKELNHLLKWVMGAAKKMTLSQLEGAMYLYSGNRSLVSLRYIIQNKYSTVLRIEGDDVMIQDQVKDVLQRKENQQEKRSASQKRSTISMNITINNVDQELCRHFLWDLSQKTIRDNFKFEFDATSHSLGAIEFNEFDAHQIIVKQALDCLESQQSDDHTWAIEQYLTDYLPHHLNRLRDLEEQLGDWPPLLDKERIGEGLYNIFKSNETFLRHQRSFEKCGSSYTFWFPSEMNGIQTWFMDSYASRKLNKQWLGRIKSAPNSTRGYLEELVRLVLTSLLRERSWDALSAYRWIEQFIILDTKSDQGERSSDINSDNGTRASVDWWQKVDEWCRSYLNLPVGQLDSLWYERLAETATAVRTHNTLERHHDLSQHIANLYEKSTKLANPSWLSYKGLGEERLRQERIEDAIQSGQEALRCAKKPSANPPPRDKEDIARLNLQLGDYYFAASALKSASEHYTEACSSPETTVARKADLGRLKVQLRSPDNEATLHFLKEQQDGDMELYLVQTFTEMARDDSHDAMINKLFSVAKSDTNLMAHIVPALEKACLTSRRELDDHVAADEIRGVLLYDRGLAAYEYQIAPMGADPMHEAVKLWKASRDQLLHLGSHVAYATREAATASLGKYYFQNKHPESMNDLKRLVETERHVSMSKAVGFLGALSHQRGDKESCLQLLGPDVKRGLHILSDDIEDNDYFGYTLILNALLRVGDLHNAAIALSLRGVPDVVTDTLAFDTEPMHSLGKRISQEARNQVPDSRKQHARVITAKEYTLAALNSLESAPVSEEVTTAYEKIVSKLDALHKISATQEDPLEAAGGWQCDGTEKDGRYCCQTWNVRTDVYKCLFCANTIFCESCLLRVRKKAPDLSADIFACSSDHKWLRVPNLGANMYVGPRARTVPIPTDVKSTEEDGQVFQVLYGSEQKMPLDDWKASVAEWWGFSLDEIINAPMA